MNWLHLRGEDLGHSDKGFCASQRVHFVADGDEAAFSKLREVLTKRIGDIHEDIAEKLKERDASGRERDRERTEQSRSFGGPPAPGPPGGWLGPPPGTVPGAPPWAAMPGLDG